MISDAQARVSSMIDCDLAVAQQLTQRRSVDLRQRRDRHHRLAVRPEHDPFDPIGGDAQPLADRVLPPRRVQHARLTDHPTMRETGCRLGQGDHLVDRVGGHEQHGIRGALDELAGDVLDDLGVLVQEVAPAHPGGPAGAGGDDAHLRPGGVGVTVRTDDPCPETVDRPAVHHVERQALRFAFDGVDHHDLVDVVPRGDPVRQRRAVPAGTGDRDLHGGSLFSERRTPVSLRTSPPRR